MRYHGLMYSNYMSGGCGKKVHRDQIALEAVVAVDAVWDECCSSRLGSWTNPLSSFVPVDAVTNPLASRYPYLVRGSMCLSLSLYVRVCTSVFVAGLWPVCSSPIVLNVTLRKNR